MKTHQAFDLRGYAHRPSSRGSEPPATPDWPVAHQLLDIQTIRISQAMNIAISLVLYSKRCTPNDLVNDLIFAYL